MYPHFRDVLIEGFTIGECLHFRLDNNYYCVHNTWLTNDMFYWRIRTKDTSDSCISLCLSGWKSTWPFLHSSWLTRYFHVTDGLVPDIMHDILEGCLSCETKQLLLYLILCKTIDLDELVIKTFPYAQCDKKYQYPFSKPRSHCWQLKQTGIFTSFCNHIIQNWQQLLVSNPSHTNVVSGQTITADDWGEDTWGWPLLVQFFLLLLMIIDHTFAPALSTRCSSYLKDLINDHHKSFKQL